MKKSVCGRVRLRRRPVHHTIRSLNELIATIKSSIAKIRQPWWVALYLLVMTLGIWSVFSWWAYDDPFITYRYAANIASGLGFVYNPGERVLSTTTPLFALILAVLHKFGFTIPLAANAISVFCLAIGGWLIWDLAQSWKTPWVGWVGLLLYPTFSLLLNTIGSETLFYLALCLGSLVLYARGQLAWSAISLALAVLTRSDGILVAFVIGLDFLFRNRPDLRNKSFWLGLPWRWIAVALGLLLGWHLFAWGYFGSPFPATLAAKQAQGAMAISTRFAPGLLRIARWYTLWPYWIAFGLALVGIVVAFVNERRWLLAFAWTGLYFLAYTVLGVSNYYWYYAPLVPAWVIAIGLGLTCLAGITPRALARNASWVGYSPKSLAILLLTILSLAQLYSFNNLRQHPDPRYPIYKVAGDWLEENTPQNASVGALEVGIIGFFARRPMVDFAGLIQPEVAGILDRSSTYEDAAFWAVQAYQPDYLVLFSEAFPTLTEDYVTTSCELAVSFHREESAPSTDLLIFDCRQ